MTEFIYKKLLGKGEMSEIRAREKLGSGTSIIAIIANILLFVGKFAVGTFTGSLSVRADAINNLSDAGSSVVSLISFKLSAKPADRRHPYGHARMEYIASMVVSFIILMIGIDLVKESVNKIIYPAQTEFSVIPLIVLGASVAVKLWLWHLNRYIGKKINSDVMKATATDSLSDALATSAVAVAMLISYFTGFDTDGYMGVIVAVIIIIAGVKILLETKDNLLGGAPDPILVEKIKEMVNDCPEAIGIHDMFIHSYGPGNTVASLHVEVDGNSDIFDVHDAIDNIEKRISTELGVICTIHMDPVVTDDNRVNEMRERVSALVKNINEKLDIHDFRFVAGPTHTNLIFDIAAPFEVELENDELVEMVQKMVSQMDGGIYFAVVSVDRV